MEQGVRHYEGHRVQWMDLQCSSIQYDELLISKDERESPS